MRLLLSMFLIWEIFFSTHILEAQSFAGQAALRPRGISRIGEQPAAIFLPDGATDWVIAGVGADWRSHLLYPSLAGPLQFPARRAKRTAYQHSWVRVQGPSLSFAVQERAVIGIGIQYRAQAQIAVGGSLAYDIMTEFSDVSTYEKERKGDHALLNSSQWNDLHLSYAYRLADNRWGRWYVGSSLHILAGDGAMQMYLPQIDYDLRASNVVSVNAYRWDARYTSGYSAREKWSALWKPQGLGLGLDVGLLWRRKRLPQPGNRWRVQQAGISLLDMGKIRFSSQSLHYQGVGNELTGNIDIDNLFKDTQGLVAVQDSLARVLEISKSSEAFYTSLPFRLRTEMRFGRENLSLFLAAEVDLHAWQKAEVSMSQPLKISGAPVLDLDRWGRIALPQEWDRVYGLQSGVGWMWRGISLGIPHWPGLLAGKKGSAHAGFWLSWHKSFFESDDIFCP